MHSTQKSATFVKFLLPIYRVWIWQRMHSKWHASRIMQSPSHAKPTVKILCDGVHWCSCVHLLPLQQYLIEFKERFLTYIICIIKILKYQLFSNVMNCFFCLKTKQMIMLKHILISIFTDKIIVLCFLFVCISTTELW